MSEGIINFKSFTWLLSQNIQYLLKNFKYTQTFINETTQHLKRTKMEWEIYGNYFN